MKVKIILLLSLFFIFGLRIQAKKTKKEILNDYDQDHYLKQVYAPITDLKYGQDDKGIDTFYKIQKPHENFLYLGANEVFFKPIGKMLAVGIEHKDKEKLEFNKGSEFHYVTNFGGESAQMEWSFFNSKNGSYIADSFFKFGTEEYGTVLSYELDNREPVLMTLNENISETPSGYKHFRMIFDNLDSGIHKLIIKFVKRTNYKVKFYNVRLSGSEMNGLYVLRNRWRARAVYSKWESSKVSPTDIKSWVMEFSSDSILGHYSPTTTFTYYGPVFKEHGIVDRVNFSLWSYGQNDPIPPKDKMSHLLGIGSHLGIFSGFKHTGTGVKVRQWNVFQGTNTSKKYAIALKYIYEDNFRTYYAYFWNEKTEKWQFYTGGRKYNKKDRTNLTPTGFLEVPGKQTQERSGNYVRKLYARGWVENSLGEWHEVDTFRNNPNDDGSGKVNGFWEVSKDGTRFASVSGGLAYRKIEDFPRVFTKPQSQTLPLYMRAKKLRALNSFPFVPKIIKVSRLGPEAARVIIKTGTQRESKVTLCWGKDNAQSNEKFWDHC